MKSVKRINRRLKFSKEFKLARVEDYERGGFSATQLSRMYGFNVQNLYNWIYKYSKYSDKNIHIVESKNSSSEKLKILESKIRDLEQALGQKQLKIDFLEKMIEIANEELGIDVKKNSNTSHLNGSRQTEQK